MEAVTLLDVSDVSFDESIAIVGPLGRRKETAVGERLPFGNECSIGDEESGNLRDSVSVPWTSFVIGWYKTKLLEGSGENPSESEEQSEDRDGEDRVIEVHSKASFWVGNEINLCGIFSSFIVGLGPVVESGWLKKRRESILEKCSS